MNVKTSGIPRSPSNKEGPFIGFTGFETVVFDLAMGPFACSRKNCARLELVTLVDMVRSDSAIGIVLIFFQPDLFLMAAGHQ